MTLTVLLEASSKNSKIAHCRRSPWPYSPEAPSDASPMLMNPRLSVLLSMPEAVAAAWKVWSWVTVTPRLEARSPRSSTRFRLFRMKAPAAKAAPVTAAAKTVTRAEVDAKALPTSASPRVQSCEARRRRGPRPSADRQATSGACRTGRQSQNQGSPGQRPAPVSGPSACLPRPGSELAQDLVATLQPDRLVDDIATTRLIRSPGSSGHRVQEAGPGRAGGRPL